MNDSDAFSMDFDGNSNRGFSRDPDCQLLTPPYVRVYAAGPLTNIDSQVTRDCIEVRAIVKRVLGSYDYQGARFKVYDPADVTQPGSNHTAEQVYETNYEQSVLADLVIFHVNAPSHGVGCESQIAADATVPRVTIAKEDVPVSRMFEGIFSTTVAAICYQTYADLEIALFRQAPLIAVQAVSSAQRRRPVLQAFSELDLGAVIFKERIIHNVGIESLASQTDIKESWLRRLERNPVLAACCTAIQLNRIADATHCYVKTVNSQNLTTLVPSDDRLSVEQRQSLSNLCVYVRSKDDWVADDRVFRLWNKYSADSSREAVEAIEYRGGEANVVSVEEWRKRDHGPLLF